MDARLEIGEQGLGPRLQRGAQATLAVISGEVELFGGSRTLLAKAIEALAAERQAIETRLADPAVILNSFIISNTGE